MKLILKSTFKVSKVLLAAALYCGLAACNMKKDVDDPMAKIKASGQTLKGQVLASPWVYSSSVANLDKSSGTQPFAVIQLFGDSVRASCTDSFSYTKMLVLRVPMAPGTYESGNVSKSGSSLSIMQPSGNGKTFITTDALSYTLQVDSVKDTTMVLIVTAVLPSGAKTPDTIQGTVTIEMCDYSARDLSTLLGNWAGTGSYQASSSSPFGYSDITLNLSVSSNSLSIVTAWPTAKASYVRKGLILSLGKVYEQCTYEITRGPLQVGTITAGEINLTNRFDQFCNLLGDKFNARLRPDNGKLELQVQSGLYGNSQGVLGR